MCDNARLEHETYLTESAVDALGHVDVVARGSPTAVRSFLGLDGDGLRGAYGLAQLASDASLLATRITAQSVLATEARAQWSLLERVVDGGWFLEDMRQRHSHAAHQFGPEHGLGSSVGNVLDIHARLNVVHIHVARRQRRWLGLGGRHGTRSAGRSRQSAKGTACKKVTTTTTSA